MNAEMLTAAAALVTALALMLGALWQGYRTRAEVRQMTHQLRSNGGNSLRDVVNRIEHEISVIRDNQTHLADADLRLTRRADAEHSEIFGRLRRIEQATYSRSRERDHP